MIIHFAYHFGLAGCAACCGSDHLDMTDDPDLVTCKRCKGTVVFKEMREAPR